MGETGGKNEGKVGDGMHATASPTQFAKSTYNNVQIIHLVSLYYSVYTDACSHATSACLMLASVAVAQAGLSPLTVTPDCTASNTASLERIPGCAWDAMTYLSRWQQ